MDEPESTVRLRALALSEGLEASATHIARVAADTSPEAASWAFTQWNLRRRALDKFKNAGSMLFTREALEQATHESVAAYHASRFPSGVLVADLCCGIGADLIALSRRGPAIGFELDEERAHYATWNSGGAPVYVGDSLAVAWNEWDSPLAEGCPTGRGGSATRSLPAFAYAFADPARRVGGRRTLNPDDFSPNPIALAEKMKTLKRGGIKLSPMLPDSFLESLGGVIELVSFGGECREALVWLGSEVAHETVSAVLIETGERLFAEELLDFVDEPMAFLYEANPAAIRAHCLGGFGLSGLGDSNGYLTSNEPISSSWLTAFRVLDFGRGDIKEVAKALRRLDCATPEIKQRGAGVEVEKWRKALKSSGMRSVYVVLYKVGASLRFVLVERL